MFEITSLAGGAVIGAGITWILERWVALFLKQLAVEHSSEFAQTTSANNSNIFCAFGNLRGNVDWDCCSLRLEAVES